MFTFLRSYSIVLFLFQTSDYDLSYIKFCVNCSRHNYFILVCVYPRVGGRAPELTVEKLPIPEALQSYENRAIPADEPPWVYFRTVEKTKTEK